MRARAAPSLRAPAALARQPSAPPAQQGRAANEAPLPTVRIADPPWPPYRDRADEHRFIRLAAGRLLLVPSGRRLAAIGNLTRREVQHLRDATELHQLRLVRSKR